MTYHLDYLLRLPGVRVERCQDLEGAITLSLEIVAAGMSCPYCQGYTEELHQIRPILVRDLPTFGRPVYLQIPRRQFYCVTCQKYCTERLEFLDWRRRHTQRYELNIYERVQQSSMEQIGREEELSYDEIKGIFEHVDKQKKKTWEGSIRVGIDEVSLRKGQQDYVTVVSDLDQRKLLEVIDSHRQDEIVKTLIQQPLEVRERVEEVSLDMWGGFPKVVEAVFPNAKIVFDRFHVMKLVNNELNKLRRAVGVTDRNSKYLLLKNCDDLTPEQKRKLDEVLQRSPCLRVAHELKEEFRNIYETSRTVQGGRKKFEKWLSLAQLLYVDSAATIRSHLDGICNYFLNRTTSGVVEGINNRIKLIKRQGYGFSNFSNFRIRLLACLSD